MYELFFCYITIDYGFDEAITVEVNVDRSILCSLSHYKCENRKKNFDIFINKFGFFSTSTWITIDLYLDVINKTQNLFI